MKRILGALFILIGLSCVTYVVTYFVGREVNGVPELLSISLKGEKTVTLKLGDEYKDEGAKASYDGKDITATIKTIKNLDLKHIGTYKYIYSITYKKQEKNVERTIKVIDEVPPEIKINGRDKIVLATGRTYDDPGATATDNYDGDITKKIKVDTSQVNTNAVGVYKVTYTVADSSGNEATAERVVDVRQAGGPNQRIAVLNYHFFYEESEKNICRESICEHMDRFREQLNYLRDNNFYAVPMDEYIGWMYGEIDLPEKSVLITVDDGAYGTGKTNGNHLIPTLEQYKMDATLFLATGWWYIEDYRSDYLALESHTHDLHYEGISGCDYRSKVNCVSYDELMTDLKKSIEILKSNNAFCFPFYDYSNMSIQAVKDAGFRVAFVGGWRKSSRNDDKYKIPRYPIQDYTSLNEFISIVN